MTSPNIAGARAVIVAWDDIIARTITGRAAALHDALAAEHQHFRCAHVMCAMSGRTFGEATRLLLSNPSRDWRDWRAAAFGDDALNVTRAAYRADIDESLGDLVTLRAQRSYAAEVGSSTTVQPAAVQWLDNAYRRGTRLVLRADSARNEVTAALGMLGALDLLDLFTVVRCSDDGTPSADEQLRAAQSVVRSYHAIDVKLTRLGIAPAHRCAFERHTGARQAAGTHVASVLRALPPATPSSTSAQNDAADHTAR